MSVIVLSSQQTGVEIWLVFSSNIHDGQYTLPVVIAESPETYILFSPYTSNDDGSPLYMAIDTPLSIYFTSIIIFYIHAFRFFSLLTSDFSAICSVDAVFTHFNVFTININFFVIISVYFTPPTSILLYNQIVQISTKKISAQILPHPVVLNSGW